MKIYATKTERMDISIDLSSSYIFVQQKWKYNWLIHPNFPNQTPWTIDEKRAFHNRSDQMIWKLWSNRAYAMMQGGSQLAQQYRNVKYKINIDIRWVTGVQPHHWDVDVYKIPRGEFGESLVRWRSRKIILDSEDYKPRTESHMLGQVPVGHELGHTFQDSTRRTLGTLDEYPSAGISDPRYHADRHSMMNVGIEVRERHFNYLKEQLNALLPTALFHIYQ